MADPRSIHEFTTGEVEATTLLLGDFVDLDAQSGYSTFKMSVSDLGEVILEDIEYTQDLQTVDKTIIGAINENKSVIGYSYDEYDATTAYAKDDLCIYNNTLYKALQATTGNLPTNTTYWEQTSIANEMSGKADKSQVGNLYSEVLTFTTINIDGTSYTANCTLFVFTMSDGTNSFAVAMMTSTNNATLWDKFITKHNLLAFVNNSGSISNWRTLTNWT